LHEFRAKDTPVPVGPGFFDGLFDRGVINWCDTVRKHQIREGK